MQKKLHIYLLLAFAFCLLPFSAYTQTYPVTISTQLTQPSPIYLTNYANTTSINSPIKVQLTLNDLTIMNRQVRLKCYFQGAVSFVTNDFVVGASPIYLDGGFPTLLTNVELGPYFEFQNLQGITPDQYAQPLPEGMYTISFEVYDFVTNKKLSKKSSVTTVIFQNEPPLLNLPANKAGVVEQNIQNIIFSWTPRSINVSNAEYEFSLVEIWNTNTPIQNAFAYSPPLFTTTTRNTTVQYSLAEPQLIPGRTYAWRVKAKALVGAEEIGVFKNNGYSEVFSFKYLTLCNAPIAISTTNVSQDQAKVTWSGAVDNFDYQINYREKNANSKWYPLVTPREYATISNLKPKTTYEYTVGAACDPNEYTHSSIQEFTTIAQDEIAFTGCGIKPAPSDLANKTPLPDLFPNDVVTAGDFPIVVLKSTGSNGTFSGEGYVTLPFLEKFKELIDAAAAAAGSDENGDSKANIGKYSRIRITFNNIGVNTDFKLISGEIVASYDPKWGGMVDGDELVEDVKELSQDVKDIIRDLFPTENENSSRTITEEVNISNITTNNSVNEDNTNPLNPSTEPNTISNTNTTTNNGSTATNTSNTINGTINEVSNKENTEVEIVYENKNYKNNDIIEVEYNRERPYFAFFLKNYPKEAKINWQILKGGTDNTSAYATNETTHDNLGIDMKEMQILDIVANYNDKKIQVTIKRKPKEFKFEELYALHNKTRLAKSTETLYLINPSSVTKDVKIVEYSLKLNPKFDKKLLPSNAIQWTFDKEDQYSFFGDSKISRKIEEKDDTKTTVNAGSPSSFEKSIDVKWINEDFKQDKLAFKYEGLDKILQLADILKEKLKIPVYPRRDDFNKDKNFSIYVEPSYKNERKNIESETDRLYYKETKNTIEIEIGAKGKIEKPVPYLAVPPFDEKICGIQVKFELGLYWFVEASSSGELGATKYTTEWIEKSSKNKSTWSYGDPSEIVLGATFGLNPKIVLEMPGVKGEASGKTSAKIDFFKYDFKKKEASCPLLTEGIKGTIIPVTELEILGFSYSKQWDKIECIVKLP